MIQGNVTYKPLSTPPAGPPGPPFLPTSADNGLSVDPVTGRIVFGNDLGGNLADLLSDREISMQGFLFQMMNNAGRKFSIDPTAALYGIGDIDAVDGGARLVVDNLQIFGSGPLGNMLLLSKLIDQYHMGDINATLNGSELVIDDFTRTVDFRDSLGPMMLLDRGNSVWTFGDPVNGNQTNLNIDDANSFTTIRDILGEMFWLDRVAGSYRIGDVSGAVNGLTLNLIDSAGTASIGDNLGQMMSLDSINALYQIGAISGQGNGNIFQVDNNTGNFSISNTAANARFVVDGNAGFTGTVTPVNSITVQGGIVTAVS